MKIVFFNQMTWIQDKWTAMTAHGDCAYLEFPNGENMLIDISTAYSGEFIKNILLDMGVKSIDYFIGTHVHHDHVGGLVALTSEIPVKKIIHPGYGFHHKGASVLMTQAMEEHQIPAKVVRAGDSMDIGEVHIDFLWPLPDAKEADENTPLERQSPMLNLNSLVCKITYGEFSALFAADLMVESEAPFVEMYGEKLRSTMLKVPHHGHDTSTSDELVAAINPKFAVITGMGCQYANSKHNVQMRFTKRCIPVYGTYSDGDIIVTTDGVTTQVTCKKGTCTIE